MHHTPLFFSLSASRPVAVTIRRETARSILMRHASGSIDLVREPERAEQRALRLSRVVRVALALLRPRVARVAALARGQQRRGAMGVSRLSLAMLREGGTDDLPQCEPRTKLCTNHARESAVAPW